MLDTDGIGILNPFRYRGYYYDVETGLYYIYSRYYDPNTCRFINSDAIAYLGVNGELLDYNLSAYCGNNPILRQDVGGKFWDTVFDILSIVGDIVDIVSNPADAMAWGALAADVVCTVVPGLTGGGSVVRFVSKADDLMDAAKYVDDIIDVSKSFKSSKELGRALHKGYKPIVESFENHRYLNRTLKKIFGIDSRLRPDAVDVAKKIIFELKPYNKESFLKALKQVQEYLDLIPGDTSDWIVVIDMYYM